MELFADTGAGVVIENIDITEAIQRGLDHAVEIFLLGNVDFGENRLTSFFIFDQLVDARRDRFLDVAADHLCAFAAKQARRGAADAAVGAGNDRHFPFEPRKARP